MLTRAQTALLGLVWLALALGVFVLAPLFLRYDLLVCGANYGEVEWTAWPPGPVCVYEHSPIPEDRMWSWTVVAAGVVLSSPLLVVSYRHPRPPRMATGSAIA